MTDREKFEAWYANRFGIYNSHFLRVGPHKDIYHSVVVQHAWETWQAALTSQPPADDGWTEWSGGKQPIADSREVSIKFRDGTVSTETMSDCWIWTHAGDGDDIIAYRVVKK